MAKNGNSGGAMGRIPPSKSNSSAGKPSNSAKAITGSKTPAASSGTSAKNTAKAAATVPQSKQQAGAVAPASKSGGTWRNGGNSGSSTRGIPEGSSGVVIPASKGISQADPNMSATATDQTTAGPVGSVPMTPNSNRGPRGRQTPTTG